MNTKQSDQMQASNIPASDQLTKNKSIYDVSSFEVFWRNFIAGIGRAFGAIFVYVFIFVGVASLVNKFLMPHILPLIGTMQTSVQSLSDLNPANTQNQFVEDVMNKPDLQNILKQVNK